MVTKKLLIDPCPISKPIFDTRNLQNFLLVNFLRVEALRKSSDHFGKNIFSKFTNILLFKEHLFLCVEWPYIDCQTLFNSTKNNNLRDFFTFKSYKSLFDLPSKHRISSLVFFKKKWMDFFPSRCKDATPLKGAYFFKQPSN